MERRKNKKKKSDKDMQTDIQTDKQTDKKKTANRQTDILGRHTYTHIRYRQT
jgi:hypothetical protein